MNTIISYLDNMFGTLPKTRQMEQLKDELLANMEEKYFELKKDGKSENEAIGVVISEFGNIDEIIEEFEITIDKDGEEVYPLLTEEDVDTYIATTKKTSRLIGFGVFLCIFGSASLVLVLKLMEEGYLSGIAEGTSRMIGFIPLFLCVAIAVGLFIYSGMKMEKFSFIEQEGSFELPDYLKKGIEDKKDAYQPRFIKAFIIGVTFIILSPAAIFLALALNENGSKYGVVVLLLIVAIAIYIFIHFGGINEAYKKLLKINPVTKQEKRESRIISAVAVIVWPLAVCIFLISGLVFNQWHINWIIFPITGILFGVFCAAYNILREKD
ncbi:permease prefix domain 1-containing protein [Alkalihalobacillus sp. 1P02AB]|uniref:permease prefix domain 1-containing protein n=1 Tax=Alkalihalobacillus sp. 1P02AB TaxID=3132260 RepID=UPI0039A5921F